MEYIGWILLALYLLCSVAATGYAWWQNHTGYSETTFGGYVFAFFLGPIVLLVAGFISLMESELGRRQ